MKKQNNKRYTYLTILLTGLLLLTGCGTEQTENDSSDSAGTIGVAFSDDSRKIIHDLMGCLVQRFGLFQDDQEMFMEINTCDDDQNTQEDKVERFVDFQYDLLCVDLVDRTKASEIVDLADGIPILFFEKEPVEADLQLRDNLYYIGIDGEAAAENQAEIIWETWNRDPGQLDKNGDGEIAYVLLEGQRAHQNSAIMSEKVIEALEAKGLNMVKLEGVNADSDRKTAKTYMEKWLEQGDLDIELVIANDDDMALGARDAMSKCNVTDIAVVGYGGTEQGKAAVDAGKFLGTVAIDYEAYADTIGNAAIEILAGQDLSALGAPGDGHAIYLPTEIYMRSDPG